MTSTLETAGWKRTSLGELVSFKTGKLDSNAATPNGTFPFFTCSSETLRTDTWSFDTECVLLAGNNANGVFPIKYFEGKFDAYQRTYVIRSLDTAVLLNRYLYYALMPKLDWMKSVSNGVATKFLTLPILNGTELDVPEVPIQRKIAAVLATYDDLIENNTRRIEVLNQLAQTLYREWFVWFRFPGGNEADSFEQAPPGWDTKSVVESPYFSFIRDNVRPYDGTKVYFATADVEGNDFVGRGIEYTYGDRPSRAQKQPEANSVWFARMQSTFKVIAFNGVNSSLAERSMLSSGFAGLRASDEWTLPFLFWTVNSADFHVRKDTFCTGATQRSLNNDGLRAITTVVPPPQLVARFDEAVGPNLDLMLTLTARNKVLRQTRDLLLPRLITGELDVSELDIDIGELST